MFSAEKIVLKVTFKKLNLYQLKKNIATVIMRKTAEVFKKETVFHS